MMIIITAISLITKDNNNENGDDNDKDKGWG